MERVAASIRNVDLTGRRLERLKTAVAEATMNAIEHGNQGHAELPVRLEVSTSDGHLVVRITDLGGGRVIPEATTPDLEAKLAGLQKPRGWGLFLIKNMVDDVRVTSDERHHTVELIMRLGGGNDGRDA
jgi:anti-sigma regulatory factor (Ser/Thr protein kinase)